MIVPRMEKEELKSKLGDPTTAIIDIRSKPGDTKISGAQIENPADVDTWMHKYAKDDHVILYCA